MIYLATYFDKPEDITIELLMHLVIIVFINIFFTHMMRFFMLRMKWLDKKMVALLPRLLVISFICAVLIILTLSVVEKIIYPNEGAETFNFGRYVVSNLVYTLLIICWNSIYFTYHFFEKSRQQELDNLSLEASKNEID